MPELQGLLRRRLVSAPIFYYWGGTGPPPRGVGYFFHFFQDPRIGLVCQIPCWPYGRTLRNAMFSYGFLHFSSVPMFGNLFIDFPMLQSCLREDVPLLILDGGASLNRSGALRLAPLQIVARIVLGYASDARSEICARRRPESLPRAGDQPPPSSSYHETNLILAFLRNVFRKGLAFRKQCSPVFRLRGLFKKI